MLTSLIVIIFMEDVTNRDTVHMYNHYCGSCFCITQNDTSIVSYRLIHILFQLENMD